MTSTTPDRATGTAVAICTDVRGPGYANGNMGCDQYPFRSTYEGASESTGGQPGN